MTVKDPSPKIWPGNPGRHFNPWWQEAEMDRKLHERGLENKTRWGMGERNKSRLKDEAHSERRSAAIHAAHAPITLPTLKWMSKP